MSEMDAIINNYDEKKYKEESSTAYETSSPQQTEYISDSFLPFHKKKLESKRISKRGVLKKFYDVQIIILNFKSILWMSYWKVKVQTLIINQPSYSS